MRNCQRVKDKSDVISRVHIAGILIRQGHGELNRKYYIQEWSTAKVAGMYQNLCKDVFL